MIVSDLTAAVAAIISIATLVLCFWLPEKHTDKISVAIYLSIVALISTLIVTSGGLGSPYISTWLMVAIFAGFFGLYVVGGMALILILQVLVVYFQDNTEASAIITHLFFGLAPLALSFILWHRQPNKRSEGSISELANRLSTVEGKSDLVINTIDDGVMAINNHGIIDLINPSAQSLVGWNKGDALGLDWRSVLKLVGADSREVPEVDNPVAQALANNKPTHSDKLYLMTQSGKKRLLSIVSSPVGGVNDGVIVVFRDITKEKVEEREQAEFISTASHEMRTPVASIEGYLGLALNPATAQIDEKARDFITKAHESARYLGRLFQDLLDISKAEEGVLKNNPQVVDVAAATENIFDDLRPLAQEKNLRFFFKPNPAPDTEKTAERRLDPVYYAHIDPHHFREVISNLIENAIKYTPKGEVVVDVTGDSKMVTVSIQDTGIGIPMEDIPHLFQKFYRVDNTDTREIGGTGLGLFLCRRLTEIMGGHLRVESVYKEGSTFFFEVPRLSHDEAMVKLQELPDDMPEIIKDRTMPPVSDQSTDKNSTVSTNPDIIPETQPTTQNFSPIATVQPVTPEAEPVFIAEPSTANHTTMTIQELETMYRSPSSKLWSNPYEQAQQTHNPAPHTAGQSAANRPQPHENSPLNIPPRNLQ